jgi:hypothetical protein
MMSCSRRLCIPKSKETLWMLNFSAFLQKQDDQVNVLSDEAGLALPQKLQAPRYMCSALQTNVLGSPACFAPVGMFDDK